MVALRPSASATFGSQFNSAFVPDRLEHRVRQQVGDVPAAAGEVVVRTNHFRARREQPFREVGSNEARTARDEYPAVFVVSVERHRFSHFFRFQRSAASRPVTGRRSGIGNGKVRQ